MFLFGEFISEASAADLLQQARWRDDLQCPRCRSKLMIKYGSYREFQRYLCKDYDRTFNDKIARSLPIASRRIRWLATGDSVLRPSILESMLDSD